MTYVDFKLVGVRHSSTVVWLLTEANDKGQDVYLSELIPFLATSSACRRERGR